ncbi:MAG: hypothetical protein HOO08_09560, partial [Opitutae bacterium]|nr:hypothetical protein [Opitutae bacterium]
PAFETVEAVVTADYTADEKRRLFNENGEVLETALRAKMIEGNTFGEAAEALALKVTQNETFKIGEAPRTFNQAALQKAQNMDVGEISPMLTSGSIGTLVYVEEKSIPEITSEDEQLVQARSFLHRYASYVSSNALVSELIARGISEDDAAEVLDKQ